MDSQSSFPYNPFRRKEEEAEAGATKLPRFDSPPDGTISEHLAQMAKRTPSKPTAGSQPRPAIELALSGIKSEADKPAREKPGFWTIDESAEALQVSASTIRRAVNNTLKLKWFKTGLGTKNTKLYLSDEQFEQVRILLTVPTQRD